MAIIPKFYIESVVSIGVKNKCSITWIGTGFFVFRKVDTNNNAQLFLVTNKHIIENKDTLSIRMIEKTSNNLINVNVGLFENGKPLFLLHDNPKIDIAVIPLNGGFIMQNNLQFTAFDIDENAMSSSELLENGFDEGSLIHMLGYPMGLVNVNSNTPICRLGCVARLDREQIITNCNILADIQNFPGNSGSPVVLRPELIAIDGTKSLSRSVLIGIIHSYIPYRESLINSQTSEVVEIRSENSGIANLHPVEFIRDIIDKVNKKI